MASKNIVIKGKLFWARVYEGNHDEFGGKEFYKITVIPDPKSWSVFNTSGIGVKPKEVNEENGDLGITFRRDVHPKTGVDGQGKAWSIGGGAPRVVNEDNEDITDLIGNGSVGEVLVNVYDITKGAMKGKKGHRLEAVKVLDLVRYEPLGDAFAEADAEETQEEIVETTTPVVKKSVKKDLPF